ncbi:ABC transporter ATP-binding protein [Methylophilaceae bacterium]|jgi:ATP-binding cassette subfamily B multidrug efflux pump|nr:ABC transporter ATP-binding protein [Methylophilaceae bacterium]
MFKKFEHIINPFPNANLSVGDMTLSKFIWHCLKGMKRYIAAMSILTGIIASIEAGLYLIVGLIISNMITSGPENFFKDFGWQLGVIAIIFVSTILLVLFQSLLKRQSLAGNMPMILRWKFHKHLLNQTFDFYSNEFSGRISAKVMQTAIAMRDLVFTLTDILIYVGIYIFTMIAIVSSFSLTLSIPFFVWLFFYTLSLIFFVPKLIHLSKNQADARSLMTGRITDAYTNINLVKLFSHSGRESSYAKNSMTDFLKTVHKQMRQVTFIEVVNHSLSVMLILSTTVLSIFLWTESLINIGIVGAATAMALRLNGISHWVMWEIASLFENIGVTQDGFNMLSKKIVINDSRQAKPLVIKNNATITFDNVSFAYSAEPVFSAFSLKIKAHERIGIVGRSGAGKSTLINLLLRFYDVSNGSIQINQQDIKSVSQTSLRSSISVVSQDNSLLHRSIKENIAYGRPESTMAEIIKAAKIAECHDFIMQLKDQHGRTGYDSHVGERGVKLSGGQKQRIAIARLALKNAPILILDEATSALDSEVETIIQQSLQTLMAKKTVIAIAHRLSTISMMDRLIVMDKGQIIEEGTHEELIRKKGLYSKLWRKQSQGFIGGDL